MQSALKESRLAGQRSRCRYGISLSRLLVVAQMAFSLTLLVAAGLFVRTLEKMRAIDLGFRPKNLLVFNLDARQAGHTDPEIVGFYGDLEKTLRGDPRSAQRGNGQFAARWQRGVGLGDRSSRQTAAR